MNITSLSKVDGGISVGAANPQEATAGTEPSSFKSVQGRLPQLLRAVKTDGRLVLEVVAEDEIPESIEKRIPFYRRLASTATAIVNKGRCYEVAVGALMRRLRVDKTYRAFGANLGEACKKLCGRSRPTVKEWEEGAEMLEDLGPNPVPPFEKFNQLRALRLVVKHRRKEVWEAAGKLNGGRAPSARLIREVALSLKALTSRGLPKNKRAKIAPAPIVDIASVRLPLIGTPYEALDAAADLANNLLVRLGAEGHEYKQAIRLKDYHERQIRNLEPLTSPASVAPDRIEENGRIFRPIPEVPVIEPGKIPTPPAAVSPPTPLPTERTTQTGQRPRAIVKDDRIELVFKSDEQRQDYERCGAGMGLLRFTRCEENPLKWYRDETPDTLRMALGHVRFVLDRAERKFERDA
jgi:hypothetical protein